MTDAFTFWEDYPHLQVAGGESDDGRFVQLWGDGRGQRQQFGQLIELAVLLLPPRPRRVLRLLLHALCHGQVSQTLLLFASISPQHKLNRMREVSSSFTNMGRFQRRPESVPAIANSQQFTEVPEMSYTQMRDEQSFMIMISLFHPPWVLFYTHMKSTRAQNLFMREDPSIHQMRVIFLENSRAHVHFSSYFKMHASFYGERSNLWKTFIYSYYIYIYDGLYTLNYAFSVCR